MKLLRTSLVLLSVCIVLALSDSSGLYGITFYGNIVKVDPVTYESQEIVTNFAPLSEHIKVDNKNGILYAIDGSALEVQIAGYSLKDNTTIRLGPFHSFSNVFLEVDINNSELLLIASYNISFPFDTWGLWRVNPSSNTAKMLPEWNTTITSPDYRASAYNFLDNILYVAAQDNCCFVPYTIGFDGYTGKRIKHFANPWLVSYQNLVFDPKTSLLYGVYYLGETTHFFSWNEHAGEVKSILTLHTGVRIWQSTSAIDIQGRKIYVITNAGDEVDYVYTFFFSIDIDSGKILHQVNKCSGGVDLCPISIVYYSG